MDFMQYIVDQGLILLPTLWIIGTLLSRTPHVPNWIIPWVLLVVGIGGALAIIGFAWSSVVQGVLIAGTAVLGNQMVKQTIEQDPN